MHEQQIWDFLYSKTHNAYGTAALMGNLFAESSLNPQCANGVRSKYGWTNEQYTYYSDKGEHDFINDGVAYGLVQWCYKTRKQGLLEASKGKSISDLDVQLNYMWKELQSYKTVLNAILKATNIRETSDVIMLKYEKPANTSEKMKAKRAAYGQKYFDQFTKIDSDTIWISRFKLESWMNDLKQILK